MLVLHWLPRLSPWTEALLDSSLLSILIFPVLYYFWLSPTTSRIDDLRLANEARLEALRRLQKIASQIPGIVFQFHRYADGQTCIPYASEAIHTIYRVARQAVIDDASPLFAAVHREDLPAHLASSEASASSMSAWHREYRLKFAGEADRWLLGNAIPQQEASRASFAAAPSAASFPRRWAVSTNRRRNACPCTSKAMSS